MARIICLANSRKLSHRCIAGIDLGTGLWVRPVSNRSDRAITRAMRLVESQEPQVLDILRIRLQKTGPNEGFQPENRLLREAAWQKLGEMRPEDVLVHCDDSPVILHNRSDRVPWKYLQALPPSELKSLQLLRARRIQFFRTTSITGKVQIRASFTYRGTGYVLPVTDPEVEKRVRDGEKISSDCIFTVSLGGPFPENATDPDCYKLVAGVIEL